MYPTQQQYGNGQPYGQPGYQQQFQFGQQNYQQFQYGQPQQESQPAAFTQTVAPQFGPAPPSSHPPHKKQKGNPVITRYPPPPGYQPPPQGVPSFGANPYQGGPHRHQSWPQTQAQQSFQPHGATPAYSQHSNWQQTSQPVTNYQQPTYQQGFNASPTQYQQNPVMNAQSFQQQSFQGSPNYQQGNQQQAWQQQPNFYNSSHIGQHGPQSQNRVHNYKPNSQPHQWQNSGNMSAAPVTPGPGRQVSGTFQQHSSFSHISPIRTNAMSSDVALNLHTKPTAKRSASSMSIDTEAEQQKPTTSKNANDPLNMTAEEWEYDDSDLMLWPKPNETVDPKLSIGIIVWHPAVSLTRALSSSFEEAEETAKQPPAKALENGDSVSVYCTLENSHDAFLDIRSLPHWEDIKDDPIFVVFPEEYQTVTLEECIKHRDRSDTRPDEPKEEGEIGASESKTSAKFQVPQNGDMRSHDKYGTDPVKHISDSEHTEPAPMNEEQEDILAKLGVTGAAKPVYPSPDHGYSGDDKEGPNRSLEPSPRSEGSRPYRGRSGSPMHSLHGSDGADGRSDRNDRGSRYRERTPEYDRRSPREPHKYHHESRRHEQEDRRRQFQDRRTNYGHRGHGYHDRRPAYEDRRPNRIPPPPQHPPLPRSPDVWSTNQPHHGRHSPARSDRSNGTAPGSDFGSGDQHISAPIPNGSKMDVDEDRNRPTMSRMSTTGSRKRSYAGDSDDGNEKHRQTDDSITPKTKRRQSEISSAYSRR